ncbi:hypothetical protein Ancab_008463 [Ancistrocladus abbreviatus]
MEDMKASTERTEKGKDLGSTAGLQSLAKLQTGEGYRTLGEDDGPNPKRAVVDSNKRDLVLIDEKTGKPIKGRGLVTKNVGEVTAQDDLGIERSGVGRKIDVAHISWVSLRDSNIENMNRVILHKLNNKEAKEIWDIGKRLGV